MHETRILCGREGPDAPIFQNHLVEFCGQVIDNGLYLIDGTENGGRSANTLIRFSDAGKRLQI